MYKLQNDWNGNFCAILRTTDNVSIPANPDNTDYAQFKNDILDGAELLDADGQVMDAIQFVKELP